MLQYQILHVNMATFTRTVISGTAPFTYSIKLAGGGDNVERFVSISGNTVTFNHLVSDNIQYYVLKVTDATGCEQYINFSLDCDCSSNLNVQNLSHTCIDGNTATISFTLIDTTGSSESVTVYSPGYGTHQHNNGDFISWTQEVEPMSIPTVYLTKGSCERAIGIFVNCQPTCTFSYTFYSTDCDKVIVVPTHNNYSVNISESSNPSVNLFTSRSINQLNFNAIKDGHSHNYIVTLHELDSNNSPTGCVFTRTFDLTCNNENVCTEILDIVLCVDDSASLSDDDRTNIRTGIEIILDTLNNSMINNVVEVGYVRFATNFVKQNLTFDKNLILQYNTDSNLGASTSTCGALRHSDEVIRGINSRNCNKIIILLTDGFPNHANYCDVDSGNSQGVQTPATIQKANNIKATPYIGSNNQQYSVKIYGIAIGNDVSEQVVKDISSYATDPSMYRKINNTNEFVLVANDIISDICN